MIPSPLDQSFPLPPPTSPRVHHTCIYLVISSAPAKTGVLLLTLLSFVNPCPFDGDAIINQTYDSSDGADYRGSRKVTLGLLSGSVLPLWSALEKTVVVCRAQMTKAEESLKVR